ncbi:MAG TPA: sigma factor, partial [Nocardioides sp.]|nr:sigma factor [Nocardioides sp.]
MTWDRSDVARGLEALRAAVVAALTLEPTPAFAVVGAPAGAAPVRRTDHWLLSEARAESDGFERGSGAPGGPGYNDSTLATSSEDSAEDRERLIGLVELARSGDAEAFGMLYDHYQPSVYRFLYYRTRSVVVAEDLCSETFFRALRNMPSFRWQGKDFGAWLMTIARNLAT